MGRKIVSIIAAAALAMSLMTGCGDSQTAAGSNTARESLPAENSSVASQQNDTAGSEPSLHASGEQAEEAPASAEGEKIPEEASSPADESLSAIEVTHLMGNGINLGNTMEAYGRAFAGVGADVSVYETAWGQPVTTPEMITAMKEAGFDTLRIPVAWTNAINFESGDYTIGSDYLERVEEIINYALDADMYVIVNDHWDGSWWGMFGSATQETRDAAMELYTSMWTQIATEYEKYDYHLIFESANEELGFRLNDTDVAADSGSLSDAECYEMTNRINQAFVDTVRSTGGNNADRFLLIAGFGTDIVNTCNNAFQMPSDPADHKLILSVHYYSPSGYCLWDSIPNWETKKDYAEMNDTLAMLTKFTDQGYGVIIGEWGVLEQAKGLRNNTLEYMENFLDNCDLYGYCPVLWDCNDMFKRQEGKIAYDEVAGLLLDHSYARQSAMTLDEIQSGAKADIDAALEAAVDTRGVDDNTALAWLMYSSSDWNISYSVGDVYDPGTATAGIVATDVEITGEGTYTVGLDFTGTAGGFANSTVFSAIGIANGETLYPGYCIEIKEILVNDEPYKLTGRPYTTSDDQKCTRLNLYNEWVSAIPDGARTASGNVMYVSPCVIDAATLGNVESIQITFEYVPGK